MDVKKTTFTGVFIAIGVLTAHIVYIPVLIAKCFPIQHAINVLLAVLLGTKYSVSAAFTISLLRNILGTGSLLAFPGSMIGATLAGICYYQTKHIGGAIAGEIFGTGIIGALVAYPVANYLIGAPAGAFVFILPFFVSTTGGSIIAYLLYRSPIIAFFQERLSLKAR